MQQGGCLLGETLIQALCSEFDPYRSCGLGQVIEGGIRFGLPPKDQRLHKSGPCEFGAAFDEARIAGNLIGDTIQDIRHGTSQLWYIGSHKEAPMALVCW